MANDERPSDYSTEVGHTITDHGAKTISPAEAVVQAGNIQSDRGWAASTTMHDSGIASMPERTTTVAASMDRGWSSVSPGAIQLTGAWADGPIATRDASVPVPGTAPAASAAAPAASAPAASAPSPGAEP